MPSDIHSSGSSMGEPERTPTIRVMVVDDHPPMRIGLVGLIKSQPGMDVVGEASNGEEAIQVYDVARPDVVLMDLRMPGIGGVEAILAIRKKHPDARVIV